MRCMLGRTRTVLAIRLLGFLIGHDIEYILWAFPSPEPDEPSTPRQLMIVSFLKSPPSWRPVSYNRLHLRCFSIHHAKSFQGSPHYQCIYATVPTILKMRLLDLLLKVKMEVSTILTLPFQNCISNTKMWSVTLQKNFLKDPQWHAIRIKVKFFTMTLQSPHTFFSFNTSIFCLTHSICLNGDASPAPTEKFICPFLCSHWKVWILSYLLYIVITYLHVRFR